MSESTPAEEPAVLGLYREHLSEQRFGDVDVVLLEALAEEVAARLAEVSAAREALDARLGELEAARAELSRRSRQALDYARVYAAGDRDLSALVQAIDARTGGTAPPGRKRRKGRPKATRDAEPPQAELDVEPRALGESALENSAA